MNDEWAKPEFMVKQSRLRNTFRVLTQFIKPLKDDRTLPTPVGFVLIALSLGIGSAAYNTSNNILFMTLSLLLACLLLSGVLAWMNLHGTRWRIVVASRYRVETPTPVRIELINTKAVLPTYSLCFQVSALVSGVSNLMCQQYGLDPGESTDLHCQFTPKRRGEETIAITRLESQFPFGFLRKSISGGLRQDVVVWPKHISYDFKPPYGKHWQHQGNTVHRRGSGTELINLRDYQPGDPMRRVHWKASARLQRMLVREMSEEYQDAYLILVETPSSVWKDNGQFEVLCCLAATLAEDLFRRGQLWGTAINDHPPRLIKHANDLYGFLDQTAILQPVESYVPLEETEGATLITFGPGIDMHVNIYIGSHYAGSTQTDAYRAMPA